MEGMSEQREHMKDFGMLHMLTLAQLPFVTFVTFLLHGVWIKKDAINITVRRSVVCRECPVMEVGVATCFFHSLLEMGKAGSVGRVP